MKNIESAVASKDSDHFGTDHLQSNLRQRTISSGVTRIAAQGIQFAFMLTYNVVQARLLTPRDFGLVAMVMTVIGFLQIFRDMGLSTATIQRADITHAQVSNLFWLNVAVSGLISLIIAAGGPVMAWFYHEPLLVNIALALSGYFVLNGLAGQHMALLNRQMRFVAISLVEVGSMGLAFSIGIILSMSGFGYWSIVVATLAQAVIRLIAIWSVSRWRPQWPVRGAGTRPLVSFGVNLTMSGVLYSASQGCDSLLIGRVFGSEAVGLYSRASAMLARPLQQLITPIYTVFVPALSRLQNQPERYARVYLQVFEVLAIAGFLFVGLVLPLAYPFTVSVLGARWEAAAVIFAGLSVAAIYVPLSSAASWLYTSQGRGEDMLRLSVFEAITTVVSVLVGLQYGPAGVAIAYSISGVLVKLPLTFYLAGRRGPVGTRALWTAFFTHTPVGLVAGGATWAVYLAVPTLHPLQKLLVCVPSCLLAAALTIFFYSPSRRVIMGIFDAVRAMKKG